MIRSILVLAAIVGALAAPGRAAAYGVTRTTYTTTGYAGGNHSNTGKGPYATETGGHVGTNPSGGGSYYGGESAHANTGKGPYAAETGGHVGNNGTGGYRAYSPTTYAAYSPAGAAAVDTRGVVRVR
jgi:hypothetical protein